jgi:dihydrofolate synthase/folylpolyglutamate synthase
VDYSLRLCGKFQVMNAAVTLEAVDMLRRRGYNVTEEAVIRGFSSLNLRSRFEVLSVLPLIIADSTHKEIAIHTVCDSMADFKEMTGIRVRLCLPVGELVEQYISALEKRGYEIESVICMGDCEMSTDAKIPTVLCQTPKSTAKAALTDLDREQILLISGNCCFTDRIRYEILATLSY